jgi:curved DNA-binding protein CbpA
MPSAESSVNSIKADAPDPYLVLGIGRRSSDAEIKRAYFQLVRQYPPESAPEKFQQIRAAYERLRTPESRAVVDLFLLQPPPDLPGRRRPSYDLSVYQEDLAIFALELAATPVEKDFHL